MIYELNQKVSDLKKNNYNLTDLVSSKDQIIASLNRKIEDYFLNEIHI